MPRRSGIVEATNTRGVSAANNGNVEAVWYSAC
jgi:hypothetical protein